MRRVKEFWKRKFNATVYMKFRVCFTLEKYEYDILSLCETTSEFIYVFCYSKIHFHQLGSFKFIKTMLNCFNVCKVYPQCEMVI